MKNSKTIRDLVGWLGQTATLKSYKYWPLVARVDNVYGDKNLYCSCPSMDEYKDSAA